MLPQRMVPEVAAELEGAEQAVVVPAAAMVAQRQRHQYQDQPFIMLEAEVGLA